MIGRLIGQMIFTLIAIGAAIGVVGWLIVAYLVPFLMTGVSAMPEFLAGVLAAFVIGHFGFWILAGLAMWIILAFIDDGEGTGVVTVALTIALGVTALANGAEPIHWLATNWLLMVVGFVCYVGAGMGWSLFKFNRFVSKTAAQYPRKEDARRLCQPSRNKSRIICWLLYWPFSIVHDLGLDLGNFLYDSISGQLQAIVDRHLGKE